MKIVVLDGHTTNPGDQSWDELRQFGEMSIYERSPAEEVIQRIGDAEIVLTNKTKITSAVLDACPNIRYIGLFSTGYDAVDHRAARLRGIPVCNVPGYSTHAVAQLVFAHLLAICQHVAPLSDAVYSGAWEKNKDFCFWNKPLVELLGKTMGIIGFGAIGKQTAQIARAMGMEVIAHSRTQTPEGAALARYVPLDTLLAESDVISLHCPLLPETEGIINRKTISQMKDGVILLNTARGPLIVEEDLADALNTGKVLAAGVDVVAVEPIRADCPLLQAKNCYITPHIGWAPQETRARLLTIVAENLRAFLSGKPIHVVNP
jgi:Lactate dehydrogenase and related dehydrogenases